MAIRSSDLVPIPFVAGSGPCAACILPWQSGFRPPHAQGRPRSHWWKAAWTFHGGRGAFCRLGRVSTRSTVKLTGGLSCVGRPLPLEELVVGAMAASAESGLVQDRIDPVPREAVALHQLGNVSASPV